MKNPIVNFFLKHKLLSSPVFVGLAVAASLAAILELLGVVLIFPLLEMLLGDSTFFEKMGLLPPLFSNKMTVLLSIVVIFVVKNLLLMFFYRKQLTFGSRLKHHLTVTYLRQLLEANYQYFFYRSSGILANFVTSVIPFAVNNFVLQLLNLIAQGGVILLLVSFLAYSFPKATLLLAIPLCLYLAFVLLLMRKSMLQKGRDFNDAREKYQTSLFSIFLSILDIKLFRREDHFIDNFSAQSKKLWENERALIFHQHLSPLFSDILIVTLLMIFAISLLHGNQTITQIIPILGIFVASAYRLSPAINRFIYSFGQMRASLPALEELDTEFGKMVAHKISNDSFQSELDHFKYLEIEGLDWSYAVGQSNFSLSIPSLSIRQGEFIGIVGQSGEGKSTLIRIILGLLSPCHGKVRVNGKDLEKCLMSWLSKCGVVHPHSYIINDTLEENITFGKYKEDHPERLMRALDASQLLEFCQKHPDREKLRVGENGNSLSEGQRQRLALARIFYHDPEVIILDEATSALDYQTESFIHEAICRFKGEKTVLIISHRQQSLRFCQRYLLVKDGLVREIDSLE